MPGQGVFLWIWSGTAWVKALGDAAGNLQVDIASSALPAGGATAAHQVTEITALQLIDDLRNALGSVNTDDLQVDVKDIAEGEIKLYAYDGANWQTLLVEAAALKNLRVKLYDGAVGIGSHSGEVDLPSATPKLAAAAQLFAYDYTANLAPLIIQTTSDGVSANRTALWCAGEMYVFNGATWDRARSYAGGIQKVGRAAIGSTTIRKTATGQVVAGAHNLYWIACSPDAPTAEFELTDAVAGGGAVVYDHFDTDKNSEHLQFDPPMKFATGIYVETFTNMKSLVFCYV